MKRLTLETINAIGKERLYEHCRLSPIHEGFTYLDNVPELIRHEIDDDIIWVGEGCEMQHWIAIYASIPKRFRIVTEVRFTPDMRDPAPMIETSDAKIVKTFDELDEMVKNALFQLSKARKEFAEFTRIQRKAEVRNAAGEYEV